MRRAVPRCAVLERLYALQDVLEGLTYKVVLRSILGYASSLNHQFNAS